VPAPTAASALVEPFEGLLWCPALVPGALLERWAIRASSLYLALDTARVRGDVSQINQVVPPGQKLALTASSFTLGAVLTEDDLGTLDGLFKQGTTGQWLRQQFESSFAWDLDRSWVRRQYAPGRYPRWHAPHAWHQDGALGFDFAQASTSGAPAAVPIEMVTCWIALNACGADSPGLEFVTRNLDRLLQPAELDEQYVRQSFSPGDFWHPALQAGDALLFRGGVPHRTYVTPGMTADRTSIELRFFAGAAVPQDPGSGLLLVGAGRARRWSRRICV